MQRGVHNQFEKSKMEQIKKKMDQFRGLSLKSYLIQIELKFYRLVSEYV